MSWAHTRVSTARLRGAGWQLNGVVGGADIGVGPGVGRARTLGRAAIDRLEGPAIADIGVYVVGPVTFDRIEALEADPLGLGGCPVRAGRQVGDIVPAKTMLVAPVLEHHLAITEPGDLELGVDAGYPHSEPAGCRQVDDALVRGFGAHVDDEVLRRPRRLGLVRARSRVVPAARRPDGLRRREGSAEKQTKHMSFHESSPSRSGWAERPRAPAAQLSQSYGAPVLNHSYASHQPSDAGKATKHPALAAPVVIRPCPPDLSQDIRPARHQQRASERPTASFHVARAVRPSPRPSGPRPSVHPGRRRAVRAVAPADVP